MSEKLVPEMGGMERRRPSVADVARLAGVSVGTVSNVLNRPETVSDPTRERVEAAIAELDFVRSGAARQLRAGSVTTVGAVLLDIANPFFTDVARGIEDRLAQDDLTLMVASSDQDPAREAKYLHLFEEHRVLGLLVVPSGRDLSALKEVQRRGTPVVVLDAPTTEAGLSSVSVDDVAGGALAASHALSLGHRRVLYLGAPHEIQQAADRRAGIDDAVRRAGLDPAVVVEEVVLPALSASGGEAALTAWVEGHGGETPGAVLCINDLVAVGVQRGLRRLGGYKLLRRTCVVGYDDIDIAKELAVPLTSVRQPTHELGYAAADLLLSRTAHGGGAGGGGGGAGGGGARRSGAGPAEHVVFRPELVVRESSGSPVAG